MPSGTSRRRTAMPRHTRLHPLAMLGVGLGMSLGLSGCFEKSPEKINALIDAGDTADALDELADQLEKQPGNPVLQVLALKAQLAHCATHNCPANRPAELQTIGTHLKALRGPVNITEKLQLDPATIVAEGAVRFAQLPDQPTPLLSLLAVTPDAYKSRVSDALFTQPLVQLRTMQVASATTSLTSFNRANALSPLYRQWAGAMAALLTANAAVAENNFRGLRNEAATSRLPDSGLRLVPNTLFNAPEAPILPTTASVSDTTASLTSSPTTTITTAPPVPPLRTTISGFNDIIAGWKLPDHLLGPEARKVLAQEINLLRADEGFLTRSLPRWSTTGAPGTVVTNLSPTVPVTDAGVALQLHLAALSLRLDATQNDLWQAFLPLAARYTEATGDATLFNGLSLQNLPAAQQQQVVADLFKLIQKQAQAGQPILPLLQQLGQLTLDRATATKLEKLVQSGLETAVTNQRLDEVLAYARFKPELARTNRNLLVPMVVNAIRADLSRGNFDAAVQMSTLLNETLKIDFNLDALLTQEFNAEAERGKLVETLSADTPEWLLQPASTVAINLGPLWMFMADHFADQPEILNDILRGLVSNARGSWGTPTAMYRLNDAFDNEEFPADKRRAYLIAAITNSLLRDDTLSPEKRLDAAARLKAQFPELALAPVVESALRTSRTLEDSRQLWQQSPQTVREVILAVRPQFAAMMRGIDAWQSGDRTVAAKAFARVTDAAYADQLGPYLIQIGEQLGQVEGLYANTANAKGQNLPALAIRVGIPAFAQSGKQASGTVPLTQLSISMLNRLGSLTTNNLVADLNPLSTSHATLKQATFPASLDLNNNTVVVAAGALERAASPAPFETTYGSIRKLTFTNDAVMVNTTDSAEPVRFTRLLNKPTATLWPDGRYSLTTPVSGTEALKNLLPPGSLLTLTSDPAADANGLYPVTGQLWHPGLSQPQDINGLFNAETLSTDFTWQAPLASGGVIKAIGRCQTVPGRILCGSHYINGARQQYAWQISGAQTAESMAATRKRLAARNSEFVQESRDDSNRLLKRLESVPMDFVSRTVPGAVAPVSATVPVSASGVVSLTTPAPVTVSATVSATLVSPTARSGPAPEAVPVASRQVPRTASAIAPTPKAELLPAPTFTEPAARP